MIKQEIIASNYFKDGLVKTFSDNGYYIINSNGIKYTEAVDPKYLVDNGERTYTETSEKIEVKETRGETNPLFKMISR